MNTTPSWANTVTAVKRVSEHGSHCNVSYANPMKGRLLSGATIAGDPQSGPFAKPYSPRYQRS